MPTQAELLAIAVEIATKAHEGQTRWDKKTPYVSHPLAVAAAFERPYEKMVAVLHDVIEDTSVTASHLREAGIPDTVIEAVETMSHVGSASYAIYINRVKKNPLAARIKTADILHNLSDLDRKKNKQRFDKYLMALIILNPRTVLDLPKEKLRSYIGRQVFSLNTGVRGIIASVRYDGKEGPHDPDVYVDWANGEKSAPFHSWCHAVGVCETA